MNSDTTITIAVVTFLAVLFGSIFLSSYHENKLKSEAIQKLVEQGTPALEAACAIRGK